MDAMLGEVTRAPDSRGALAVIGSWLSTKVLVGVTPMVRTSPAGIDVVWTAAAGIEATLTVQMASVVRPCLGVRLAVNVQAPGIARPPHTARAQASLLGAVADLGGVLLTVLAGHQWTA